MFIRRKEYLHLTNFKQAFLSDIDALCVIDRLQGIKIMNSALLTMLGISPSERYQNHNFSDYISIKPREESTTPWENVFWDIIRDNQRASTKDYDLINKKGEPIPIRISVAPIVENNYYFIKIQNITKDLERERIQNDFISIASHEMRTPIAIIEGYLSIVLNPETSTIDNRARKFTTLAYDATKRLSELFKSLLDVSRLDQNRIEPNLAEVDIIPLTKQVVEDNRFLAEKKHQSLSFKSDFDHIFCSLDNLIYREIIMNLITNAIKYTAENGNIHVSIKPSGSTVGISVTDNGEGISKEDLKHIYQRFYRVHRESTTDHGTGLGLYVSKRQTELMHGQISAESQLGKGSTFTVTFPLSRNQSAYEEPIFSTTPPGATIEEVRAHDPNNSLPKVFNSLFTSNKAFEKLAERYTEPSRKYYKGELSRTADADIERIRQHFYKHNSSLDKPTLNAIWTKFKNKVENPGLALLLIEHPPTEIMIPWILNLPKASCWEYAFQKALNIKDEWTDIPAEKNIAFLLSVAHPVYNWIRERAILTAKEIEDKDSVLFLGAGYLPELRHIPDYRPPKEVWACDIDTSIDINSLNGWRPAEHNVHYEIADMIAYMEDLDDEGLRFDNIVMNGCTIDEYTNFEEIIEKAQKLLKPGGRIVFDVQVWHRDFYLSAELFGVENETANMPKDVNIAIKNVTAFTQKLWGTKTYYIADRLNDEPTGVLFYIEKSRNG